MCDSILRLRFAGTTEPQGPNGNTVSSLIEAMRAATLNFEEHGSNRTQAASMDEAKIADRLRLLDAAKEMVAALDSPKVAVLEIAKGPAAHAVFRTALRLNIFGLIGDGETVSAENLAPLVSTERLLVIRIMRTLVGIGIFSEAGEEAYRHNKRSLALKHPAFRTFVSGLSETTVIMPKLPDFLASLTYQNPSDRHNALFQYANNTNLNLFEWMQDHPEQLARFSGTMSAVTELQAPSLEATLLSLLPPKNDALREGPDAGKEVLLVDVGGGRGDALSSVRKQRSDLKGRIIVQDLPKEIEGREPVDGIEAMAYDFFTPQPVRGARVYFFSHIFHDWPDPACRQILHNILPALIPGKSKIMIVDIVVPEVDASAFTCMMDISMMAFGGMERTEKQWRQLLEGAGLRIVRIEDPKKGSLTGDSVIEAEIMSGRSGPRD